MKLLKTLAVLACIIGAGVGICGLYIHRKKGV
jgi:hypothetical protein